MRRVLTLALLALVLMGWSVGQAERDDATPLTRPKEVAEKILKTEVPEEPSADELLAQLDLTQDFHDEF